MESLEKVVNTLASDVIAHRRRSADMISEMLDSGQLRAYMTKTTVGTSSSSGNHRLTWITLIDNINSFLIKEAAKLQEEEKKGKTGISWQRRALAGKLLVKAVAEAKHTGCLLKLSSMMKVICSGLEDKAVRENFSRSYLEIMTRYMLTEERHWFEMREEEFTEIILLLKRLYQLQHDGDGGGRGTVRQYVANGMHQVARRVFSGTAFGPQVLRRHLAYLQQMVADLEPTTGSKTMLDTLAAVADFLAGLATESRLACCQLGEELASVLVGLYDQREEDRRNKIFEFWLTQVKMHHPNGAAEGSRLAYAYDWTKWKAFLDCLRSRLRDELAAKSRSAHQSRLSDFFVQLYAEFVNLFASSNITRSAEDEATACKRSRVESEAMIIITEAKTTSHVNWLIVLNAALAKYPQVLAGDEFGVALKEAADLLHATENPSVRQHLNDTFVALLQVERNLEAEVDREKIWFGVWETCLRALGLNHGEESTHRLLQVLMAARKTPSLDGLLKMYLDGAVRVCEASMQTLLSVCRQIAPQMELSTRRALIEWVLSPAVADDLLMRQATADLLAALVLKSPLRRLKEESPRQKRRLEEFEHVYRFNCLDSLILDSREEVHHDEGEEDADESTALAEEALQQVFAGFGGVAAAEGQQHLHRSLARLVALLRFLQRLQLALGSALGDALLQQANYAALSAAALTAVCRLKQKEMVPVFGLLEALFAVEVSGDALLTLRNNVPDELVLHLVELLNDNEDDVKDIPDDLEDEVKISPRGEESAFQRSFNVLSRFCCLKHTDQFTSLQKKCIDMFVQAEDEDLNSYKVRLCLIERLASCRRGILPDKWIVFCLDSIERMLKTGPSFDCQVSAVEALKGVCPHISEKKPNLQLKLCRLLMQVLNISAKSIPKLAVCSLKCVEETAKECFSTKPDFVEVYGRSIRFLCSSFSSVRLAAIQCLAAIFTADPSANADLHQQLLDVILGQIPGMLTIAEEACDAGKVDETLNRTVCVLQLFAALILANWKLRQALLFRLVVTVHKRDFSKDLTMQCLDLVSCRLGLKSGKLLLESNLDYILFHWTEDGLSLDSFPCYLLNFTSSSAFNANYLGRMMPLLLSSDVAGLLNDICQQIGAKTAVVVAANFSKIAACYLPNVLCCDLASERDVAAARRVESRLHEILGQEAMDALLERKLGSVLAEVARRVHDPDHFCATFEGLPAALSDSCPPHYTADVFLATMERLKGKLTDGQQPMVEYIVSQRPAELQHLLGCLTADIAGDEDKPKAFHRFCLAVGCFLQQLNTSRLQHFALRTALFAGVNALKTSAHQLGVAACRFLHQLVTTPEHAGELGPSAASILVARLVPLAQDEDSNQLLTEECLRLLHACILHLGVAAEINLDPFPPTERFSRLNRDYVRMRYGNEQHSLHQEIQHFLKAREHTFTDCRPEGLRHLRQQLTAKKAELKLIYEGIPEQGESILHQLIRTLVALTTSNDKQVRMEAAKCLGEIGPGDLRTMILQLEKCEEHIDDPLEVIAGRAVALLADLVVHWQSAVAQTASEALYRLLNSREGRNATKSGKDYGCGVINAQHILPYLLRGDVKACAKPKIGEDVFERCIDQASLWCPAGSVDHSAWIQRLVRELLNTFEGDTYLKALADVASIDVNFSESILAPIVNLILVKNRPKCSEIVGQRMQQFFQQHWRRQPGIVMNHASVKCLLDVVHFIRLQESHVVDGQPRGQLRLNYLHVAQAAQFCSAHFTALLYAELWCQENFAAGQNLSTFDYSQQDEESEEMLLKILKANYIKIGDFDALHASYLFDTKSSSASLSSSPSSSSSSLPPVQQLLHSASPSSVQRLLAIQTLGGLYAVAGKYGLPEQCRYECAWRLDEWTLNEDTIESFEKHRFLALRHLQQEEGGRAAALRFIDQGRAAAAAALRSTSLESSRNIYTALGQLRAMQELEDALHTEVAETHQMLDKWRVQDSLGRNEFIYAEPIIAQRICIVRNTLGRPAAEEQREQQKRLLAELNLDLAELARSEGFPIIANNALLSLGLLADLPADLLGRQLLQKAQLVWPTDQLSGKRLMRQLLSRGAFCSSARLHASALRLYAGWMAETRFENPKTIIDAYFLRSLELSGGHCAATSDALARFADAEYEAADRYTASAEFQAKLKNMAKSRLLADGLGGSPRASLNADERKALLMHRKQSEIDEREVKNVQNEKEVYLLLALKSYLVNLERSEAYDARVFRVLSLWLKNRSAAGLVRVLQEKLPRVPAHKFIPLLPQLVPHLSRPDDELFAGMVKELLVRCSVEHPHHTLPVILAVANSYKDREHDKSRQPAVQQEARVAGAIALLTHLRRHHAALRPILEDMEAMSAALIQLAYQEAPQASTTARGNAITIPRQYRLRSLKDLSAGVPTVTVAVRPSANYADGGVVTVRRFGDSYSLVGGINAPKKLECHGSDGRVYVQLIKGRDDLRQDAVMQQVFGMVNTLLRPNEQTRQLSVRTYKVVPLSQRSGIIEWCENTEPLGHYLDKAHSTYHPDDFSSRKCREEINSAAKNTNERKLKVFERVCANYRPVFRHFFFSSFPQPTVFYERRRAYMMSLATSSMIGYILGIGDRHVQNILIDKTTAEVIHIDFGIAFEQGRVLPTPETVPFRLTRDLEDGMGICGVEGVFRRSCEKTMHALRQNADTILTILEVLLYDPLYTWTLSPQQAYSKQCRRDSQFNFVLDESHSGGALNITAERALSRLRAKLQGVEEGAASCVEGQVERLIQQARDPANLSRLYHGWQAYM